MKPVSRTSRTTASRPACRRKGAGRGFTLVELLVVMVILGILITLILVIAPRIVNGQKTTTTKNTMRLVELAIEQFATQNPLAARYDNDALRDVSSNWVGRIFGPYPPYMLNGAGQNATANSVGNLMEPYSVYRLPGPATMYVLADRLHRDLKGDRQGNVKDWASDQAPGEPTPPSAPAGYNDTNDDIRSLYAYLKVYAPGTLSQIPESVMKPLPAYAGTVRYVNPYGQGTNAPAQSSVQVLGIYDAWGVPLDYFQYVKLETANRPDGTIGWRFTDRVPVLRSLAITPEEAANEAAGTDPLDPHLWIFSKPFPLPAAQVNPITGTLPPPMTVTSGWFRAVAGPDTTRDSYSFVP